MAKPKGAYLPNLTAMLSTGIDPTKGTPALNNSLTIKNGLPYGGGHLTKCNLQADIFKQLKIIDLIDHNNAYKWNNLPSGLTGQLLERILYYRGQGVFFYQELNDKFYFLPYTQGKNGNIDVYGRMTRVTPVQYMGGVIQEGQKDKPFIQNMTLKAVYDLPDEVDYDLFLNSGVILKDYEIGVSEWLEPRATIQDSLLQVMSEAFPLARTSLISNSGVRGVRVGDENQSEEVLKSSGAVVRAALQGNPWIPIVGATEFQELTGGAPLKSEEYLLYLQALDSYRLSQYGFETGGLFQKKAHMLEGELAMNGGHAEIVYQSGLTLRQNFCDIVNSIWGLGITVEPSESVLGADLDGDGVAFDNQDQSGGFEPIDNYVGGDSNGQNI